LLRLLASKEGQSPNWFDLGDLILNQGAMSKLPKRSA
jgi:hypothetical protein